MTGKQLINHLCYEYNTTNYNEERLKAAQEIRKDLDKLDKIKKILFEEDITYIEMTIKIRKVFGHGN